MASFLVRTADGKEDLRSLDRKSTSLGRHPDNDIALDDHTVSRRHALVERDEAGYTIRDLGSKHGTFVDDVAAEPTLALRDGARVRLGTTELTFCSAETRSPEPRLGACPQSAPFLGQIREESIAYSLPSDGDGDRSGLSEQHLVVLSRVAKATQSVFDLDELLETLMDMLFEIFHPDRGAILLSGKQDGELLANVMRPTGEEAKISQTILDYAVARRRSLLIADLPGDSRFSEAESIVAQSILSAICCPLVCKDKVLGVLYIDTQSHRLTYHNEELALLNIIAANAAISIENAILVREKLESERLAAIGLAIAGISHYIKNVMSGILGASNLIERGLRSRDLEVIEKVWPVMQNSNQRLTRLVQDMLTYSKKREPQWLPGNLNDLLREVHAEQASRAERQGTELRLELDATLPDSLFDPSAIHDAILNIVTNAIEACARREGACVTLRSSLLAGERAIRLSIEDNGPGIAPEARARIFEPFFSTKGSKGTGLGLAVARKSVEEHSGRLEVESRAGGGTIFHVLLPIERKAADPALTFDSQS